MKRTIMAALALAMICCANAQTFKLENPNKKLSPYTGVTRDHWKQAAEYLLDGAFAYVNDIKEPMNLPKQAGKSYPRDAGQVPTARMEALCRTMFLAGPLLKENPDLTLHGIKIGDYYRYQMTSFLDPQSPVYLPMKRGGGNGGQKLVELGGLSLSLLLAPDVFWDPLPKDVRDSLATVMLSYGEGGTIDMNWRFFNMCILSFFDSKGYKVNKSYLEDLLHKNLKAYVGGGWYHDSPLFDYYSMWAFQMYGPLWAESYGKKYYPEEAKEFMSNLRDITIQYPYMFGRNGKMQMWGRSITYRMGAAVPLALTGLLNDKKIDYGWMRRICSGALMQFVQHPDFLADDGLPNLGFYGHFEPCLQHYSCRGSVYWMAKLFLALYMPADNPFWTATETEGTWAKLKGDKPLNMYVGEAKTMTTNYPATGMSEFRNVFVRNNGFYYGLESYNRLSYNSELPWQADGDNGEVAMSYMVQDERGKWHSINTYSGVGRGEDGYFYREAKMENDDLVNLHLKEIPTSSGMIRKDRILCAEKRTVHMGYYALPQLDKPITESKMTLADGTNVMVIDNGKYQLVTVMLGGWESMKAEHCRGKHPEAEYSTVVDMEVSLRGEVELTSALIIKRSGEPLKLDKEVAKLKKEYNL